mmetsp:Transcript_8381/g.23959  ORF Transcript_8381/g.23959 Transcript_8381/m.23959 type:complete len:297 (-) Transcript_8381:1023-1913(-)
MHVRPPAVLVTLHVLVHLLWGRGPPEPGGHPPGVGPVLLRGEEVRVRQPCGWTQLSHEARKQDRRVQLVRRGRHGPERVGQEGRRPPQGAQGLENPLLLRLERALCEAVRWPVPPVLVARWTPSDQAARTPVLVLLPRGSRDGPVKVNLARRHWVLEVPRVRIRERPRTRLLVHWVGRVITVIPSRVKVVLGGEGPVRSRPLLLLLGRGPRGAFLAPPVLLGHPSLRLSLGLLRLLHPSLGTGAITRLPLLRSCLRCRLGGRRGISNSHLGLCLANPNLVRLLRSHPLLLLASERP